MFDWLYQIKPPGKPESTGIVKATTLDDAKCKIKDRRKIKNLRGLRLLVRQKPWKVFHVA